MLNQEGLLAYPPVRWVQHDAAETEALAEEFSQSDELIGSHWHLGYGLVDHDLISDLYKRLSHQHSDDQHRRLVLNAVAAFYLLQKNQDSLVQGTLEAYVQRAMTYLAAPSPWFGKESGLHVVLAHSAHFVLDPEGFANMQRVLSVTYKDLFEVATVIA